MTSRYGGVSGRDDICNKEGRIAAAFREILYLKGVLAKVVGAPSFASDPSVFQIPLLSHETWITSF